MVRSPRRQPTRPRQPGERRRPGIPASDPRWIIALAIAVVALATAGMFLIDRVSGQAGTGGATPVAPGAGSLVAHDPTLALPLALADVGFNGGELRESTVQEGPGTTLWCGRTVDTSGLDRWRGSRLTEAGAGRRVLQLVTRFDTAADATGYLAAVGAQLDCGNWESTTDGRTLRFALGPDPGGATLGQETRRVDVEATGSGPALHLRTIWIRDGLDVTQLTLVTLDRDALDPLEADVLSAISP